MVLAWSKCNFHCLFFGFSVQKKHSMYYGKIRKPLRLFFSVNKCRSNNPFNYSSGGKQSNSMVRTIWLNIELISLQGVHLIEISNTVIIQSQTSLLWFEMSPPSSPTSSLPPSLIPLPNFRL